MNDKSLKILSANTKKIGCFNWQFEAKEGARTANGP
jgi:hypothetical protein